MATRTTREIAFELAARQQGRFASTLTGAANRLELLRRRLRGVGAEARHAQAPMAGMGGWFKGLLIAGTAALSIDALKSAYESVNGVITEDIRANTRLQTLMMNVPKTSQAAINGILRYSDKLQGLTVVAHDVTTTGASQLATYQLQAKSIKAMMPALQDLAVGQFGVNVNQEQIINSANLMGKVFTGQVGALRRAGVSFNKQQEAVLKTGTEMQRVNMIVQVLKENYGGLADKMRYTPEGRIRMLRNAWDEVKESIGRRVIPYTTKILGYLAERLPAIQAWALGAMDTIEKWWGKIAPKLQELSKSLLKAFEMAKPSLEWLMNTGLPTAIDLLSKVLSYTVKISNWIINHWNDIAPIIAGIITAFITWKALVIGTEVAIWAVRTATIALGITQAIISKIQGIMLLLQYTTQGAAGAQLVLNAAIAGVSTAGIAIAVALVAAMTVKLVQMHQETKALEELTRKIDASTVQMQSGMRQRVEKAYAATGANRDQVRAAIRATRRLTGQEAESWWSMAELNYLKQHYPKIKGFARGGIISREMIARLGERGPEAVVPLADRARGLAMHRQVGNLLGVGAGMQITYAPVIHVDGGSGDVQGQVQAGLRAGYHEFLGHMRRFLEDQGRLAYGN